MKKNVTVMGIGERRKGVSKAGNAYDFFPVALSYCERGFNGSRVCEVSIESADLVDFGDLYVGDELIVFMHEQNFRMKLDGIVARV